MRVRASSKSQMLARSTCRFYGRGLGDLAQGRVQLAGGCGLALRQAHQHQVLLAQQVRRRHSQPPADPFPAATCWMAVPRASRSTGLVRWRVEAGFAAPAHVLLHAVAGEGDPA